MSKPIRVRFAPSPTGYLHVGGARTALYNYLFAKQKGGTFVLRIEDTDVERSTDESLRMQIQDLQWLGLKWDEGVDPETLESVGEKGPYRQSQRLDIYKKYCDQLLERGLAYHDFRSEEELEAIKNSGEKYARIPRPESILSLPEAREKVMAGAEATVRFKVDGGRDHIIQDLVRGEVRLPEDMVGDFVIMRSNGMPVYNFCCAIDDALMEISHVFRAEEHLSNTLRQKMIYDALDFETPQFGHMSLILGSDKQKLSKRHGATSCHQYKELGYLPDALVNFVALLGWSPGDDQEVLTREQLIELFDVTRLNPAGAVFDEEKFKWMNSVYLRDLPHQELWNALKPLFAAENITLPESEDFIDKSLTIFKTKMETLKDAVELYRPVDFKFFEINADAQDVMSWESTTTVFKTWRSQVNSMSGLYMSADEFEAAQNRVKEAAGVKGKHLFMPIRVAIIGRPHGADLKSLVPLIDKDSLLKRVDAAIAAQP